MKPIRLVLGKPSEKLPVGASRFWGNPDLPSDMDYPTYKGEDGWETWDHPYEDWQILLQVDSFSCDDFNLNFMDCGVLDFLISPQDLATGNFDSVRAILLST